MASRLNSTQSFLSGDIPDTSQAGTAHDIDFPTVEFAPTSPWWGRISLLWLLFVPICAVIYVLCLPIAPNDFWYHARAGQLMVQLGHIPTTNLSSTGQPLDKPYFYQSWLAEWIFYQVLAHGGLTGIVLLRAVCIGGTYGLIVFTTYRRALRIGSAARAGIAGEAAELLDTRTARITICGALFAFLISINNVDVRPQLFSLPLFALFIFLIFEWPYASRRGRIVSVAVSACAMMLWANTHGAFITGLAVLIGSFGTEIAYRLFVATKTFPRLSRLEKLWGSPLAPQTCLTGGIGVALALLATLINPHGFGLYGYVATLAGNETSQKYIQEWQAPEFSLAEWNSALFLLSPIVLALLLVQALRNRSSRQEKNENPATPAATGTPIPPAATGWLGPRLSEMVVLGGLFAMATHDKRSIMWFALFVAPILGSMAATISTERFQPARSDAESAKAGQLSDKTAAKINLALAVFLLLLPVPALPWIKPLLDLPPAFRARFAPTPRAPFPAGFPHDPPLLLDRITPVEAAAYLRAHPPKKRLFNDMVQGSYLMWALPPYGLPSSDPRIELYPTAFWEDYLRLGNGPPDAAAILEKRGYSDALLDTQYQPGLIQRLLASPDWQLAFKHRTTRLFRHTPPPHR